MNDLMRLQNMKKTILRAMGVAILAILPSTAQAVPITGTMDLAGLMRITATTIEWLHFARPRPAMRSL